MTSKIFHINLYERMLSNLWHYQSLRKNVVELVTLSDWATETGFSTIVTDNLKKERKKNLMKTRLFKYIENFTSKNWKFSDKKNPDIFHISAQNIDCGYWLELPRRGGSNEYPQSMFLSRNKKNNVPLKPQFY